MAIFCATLVRHVLELAVEIPALEKEAGMDRKAIDFPADDAAFEQFENATHQHLGDGVKSGLERRVMGFGQGRPKRVGRDQGQIVAVPTVPQQQGLGNGVADRSDADLQRSPVGDQLRHMETDGLVLRARRPADDGEQLERRSGFIYQVDLVVRDDGRAIHERQIVVDLDSEAEIGVTFASGLQQIDGDVGVAAQAHAAFGITRHQLRHDIRSEIQNIAKRMGVVGRDVVALRIAVSEPATGLKKRTLGSRYWRAVCPFRSSERKAAVRSNQTGDPGRARESAFPGRNAAPGVAASMRSEWSG